MFRVGQILFTTLLLDGLLLAGLAGAQSPTTSRLPPVGDAVSDADPAVTLASYNEPAGSDDSATITSVPAPLAAVAAPGTAPPSVMAYGPGFDQFRRGVRPFVGIETVFLAPVHNTGGGGANYSFDNGATTVSYNASSANGMVVTPRIWVGLTNDRWGVGFRYWGLSNNPAGAEFPGSTSQGVYSDAQLKLQTFDLEAIRRFQFDNDQQLWFTVGARYAQFSRFSSISSGDIFNHGLYLASAASGARFIGAGITASVYGMTPLGESKWNLFYGGRVSYLGSGTSSAFATSSASFNSNTTAAGAVYPSGSIGDGDAFIGELQFGAQYSRDLESLPATVFFRIGCEFQYWHVNNGSSASSNADAGPNVGGTVFSTASAGNSNLSLLGFGLSTGFAW
ncbi:MAG TPA: hypothetical protein VMF30_14975 [Pirellulales bacterium]|nr:hypothetical protein [Pirellulales bacterium]